jgi:hypothetical protein
MQPRNALQGAHCAVGVEANPVSTRATESSSGVFERSEDHTSQADTTGASLLIALFYLRNDRD